MNMLTPLQMASRDWYLDQLRIRQYQLRTSSRFCDDVAFTLSAETRLIIVSESLTLNTPFLRDVLAAIGLTPNALLWLNPSQSIFLPDTVPGVIWLMDPTYQDILSSKYDAIILTPVLPVLMQSSHNKRRFWRQLCDYESYFRT